MKATVRSSEGVQQGDPLGPALFALGVEPVFKRAREGVREGSMLSYAILDDYTMVGAADSLATAYRDLVAAAKEIANLDIVQAKTKIVYLHGDTQPLPEPLAELKDREGLQLVTDSTIILGTPTGTDEECVNSLCDTILNKQAHLFAAVLDPNMPTQEALLVIRASGLPRMNYCSRTIHPDSSGAMLSKFDNVLLDTVLNKLQIDREELTHLMHSFALRLPVRLGGMGFRPMEHTRFFAWWGALAQAVPYLARIYTQGQGGAVPPAHLMQPMAAVHTIIRAKLTGTEGLNDLVPESADETLAFYDGEEGQKRAQGLQKALTALWEDKVHKALLLDPSVTLTHKARMLSTASPGAGAWVTAIPTSRTSHLSNKHYAVAARIRIGLQPSASMPTECFCGASLVTDPSHHLSCNRLRTVSTTQRHNKIVQAIHSHSMRAGALSQLEPKHLQNEDGRRTDILLTFAHGVQDTAVDVMVTHPGCQSHVQAAQRSLGAARKAVTLKNNKHKALLAVEGIRFIPFIMESYGALAEESRSFITELALMAAHEDAGWTTAEAHRTCLADVSVANQRGNAITVLTGLAWSARVKGH